MRFIQDLDMYFEYKIQQEDSKPALLKIDTDLQRYEMIKTNLTAVSTIIGHSLSTEEEKFNAKSLKTLILLNSTFSDIQNYKNKLIDFKLKTDLVNTEAELKKELKEVVQVFNQTVSEMKVDFKHWYGKNHWMHEKLESKKKDESEKLLQILYSRYYLNNEKAFEEKNILKKNENLLTYFKEIYKAITQDKMKPLIIKKFDPKDAEKNYAIEKKEITQKLKIIESDLEQKKVKSSQEVVLLKQIILSASGIHLLEKSKDTSHDLSKLQDYFIKTDQALKDLDIYATKDSVDQKKGNKCKQDLKKFIFSLKQIELDFLLNQRKNFSLTQTSLLKEIIVLLGVIEKLKIKISSSFHGNGGSSKEIFKVVLEEKTSVLDSSSSKRHCRTPRAGKDLRDDFDKSVHELLSESRKKQDKISSSGRQIVIPESPKSPKSLTTFMPHTPSHHRRGLGLDLTSAQSGPNKHK